MTKIKTLEQLSDKIAEEIAWRKKELAAFKRVIDYKSLSADKNQALLRSGVMLLYSHWEGFIKIAANSYLEFVAMQRLPYKQLSNNFIALTIKQKLDQAQHEFRINSKPDYVVNMINSFQATQIE
jgi:hypothetical protein